MAKALCISYDSNSGSVSGIYYDEHKSVYQNLGMKSMKDVSRASHVEPAEDGNGWNVDMSPIGGPKSIGTFDTREEALAAEVEWLKQNL